MNFTCFKLINLHMNAAIKYLSCLQRKTTVSMLQNLKYSWMILIVEFLIQYHNASSKIVKLHFMINAECHEGKCGNGKTSSFSIFVSLSLFCGNLA